MIQPNPIYYQLPVLIVVICLVYSATRYDDWGSIFYEAFRWGIRMGGFLVVIAAALFLLAKSPFILMVAAIAGVVLFGVWYVLGRFAS